MRSVVTSRDSDKEKTTFVVSFDSGDSLRDISSRRSFQGLKDSILAIKTDYKTAT